MEHSKAYEHFIASMTITHEMWHDGIGYDLDALSETTPAEVAELVEKMKGCGDWRDVEALAAIAGMAEKDQTAAEAAKQALTIRAKGKDKIGLRAAEALGELGEDSGMEEKVIETLLKMGDGDEFSQALDLCEEIRSDRLKLALLKCAKEHGTMGVHCAAMLYYHAGLAKEAFDWDHRPFFLRFNAEDEEDRARAFEELCAKTGLKL
jgi:hypothetical protein